MKVWTSYNYSLELCYQSDANVSDMIFELYVLVNHCTIKLLVRKKSVKIQLLGKNATYSEFPFTQAYLWTFDLALEGILFHIRFQIS